MYLVIERYTQLSELVKERQTKKRRYYLLKEYYLHYFGTLNHLYLRRFALLFHAISTNSHSPQKKKDKGNIPQWGKYGIISDTE